MSEPVRTRLTHALLSILLAAGLLPEGMLQADEFSTDIHRQLVRWLSEGKKQSAFMDELQDEQAKTEALRALNFEPLPEDRDTALEMANSSLKTMRRARMEARIARIKEEINTADPERKAELYEQMTVILSELDD